MSNRSYVPSRLIPGNICVTTWNYQLFLLLVLLVFFYLFKCGQQRLNGKTKFLLSNWFEFNINIEIGITPEHTITLCSRWLYYAAQPMVTRFLSTNIQPKSKIRYIIAKNNTMTTLQKKKTNFSFIDKNIKFKFAFNVQYNWIESIEYVD